MKTIIAGSRTIADRETVFELLERIPWEVTEVVSGAARGVDVLGEQWASDNRIRLSRFPASWHKHGKAAGPIRNQEMADYADALVAIWDGESRGTKDMIDKAMAKGLQVKLFQLVEEEA